MILKKRNVQMCKKIEIYFFALRIAYNYYYNNVFKQFIGREVCLG